MLEKILLDNVLDDTFKKKIDNKYNDCLRNKGERLKCEECFNICPEKAIELEGDFVRIDPILCSGCNLCVSKCYSRALTPVRRPYLKAINYFMDGKISNWGCNKTKDKCDVNFGCLNNIDPKFLYALGFSDINQNIYLDFSKCSNCEYENMGYNTRKTMEYITIHGELENLLLINGFKDSEESEVLDRRDFFKNVFNTTKDYSKETIRETTKSFGFDVDEKEDLDDIINILLKHGIKKERSTGFLKDFIYELDTNVNCTLCFECVSYCPNNALSIENKVDSQNLVLDMSKCTFCNRCVERCRFEALYKKDFIDREKKTIHKKEKSRCKSCKVLSVELNDEGKCTTCEKRSRNRRNK